MEKYLKLILFAFVLSDILFAQKQEIKFDHFEIKKISRYELETITISDGLHSNNINDVLQDSLGFLWLACDNGIQKYDGYKFTYYIPDSASSAIHRAYRLYEDQNRNIWISTGKGLSRYIRESDDFLQYYFTTDNKNSIPYRVSCITEDLNGNLWVWIQDSGLYKINFETQSFNPQDTVNLWYQDIRNQILLKEGNQKGIYETWITFPPEHYGAKLQYKFAIKRKNGTLEWEPYPNPGNNIYGNRQLFLTGDTLILPAVSFNSKMQFQENTVKNLHKSDLKSTYVKFSVNLINFNNPPSEEEELQVRGNILPLLWNPKFSITSVIFESEYELWIATDLMGLYRINLETGKYNHFAANPEIRGSISAHQINTAMRDQNGDLWLGTRSGLNKYNPDNNTFEQYFVDPSNKSNNINCVYQMKDDGHGYIWTQSILDHGGVSCFNKKNKQFTHYSDGLDLWLSAITIDQSGIVWVGNQHRGLHKLNPKAVKFSAYSIIKNGKDFLKGKAILAVYEDQAGEIWVGGDMIGIFRYNKDTGKTTAYGSYPGHPDSLVTDDVMVIFQDRKGILWIGTYRGLIRFDPKTENFKRIEPASPGYQGFSRTTDIYENERGILWLVTRNGYLIKFNPETYETEIYSVFGNSDVDRQMEFVNLVEDPAGFIWIATANWGLLKFDLMQKKFSIVEQIKKVNISSFQLDSDGILWCGTDQGLIRYNTETDTSIIIGEKDGLLSNGILGLEQDHSGNLWLSSRKGLSKYNPRTNQFKHYFKEDGFLTNEFSYMAHAKGKNGEIIFGSRHGVVTFHPDNIKDSEFISPIVLTDFKILNKPVNIGENSPLKKHISVSNKILLSHNQNDISISYAALDFSHPQRNRYSFMLENFEENWRSPGKERTAYYTNLDPGEYIFRVKGTNGDGIWNEEGRSLRLIIFPPWWKTWWAYSLYSFIILGIIYSLRRYEMNRIRLKNQVKIEETKLREREHVDQMKSSFFTNISHEFRTPLTLILGPLNKLLSNNLPDDMKRSLQIMQRNANRLLRLINQLLDFSRLESGKMKLQASKGDIISFVKGLLMSFQSLAEQKNISCRFTSDQESVRLYFDRDKMEKIITNLLSNAFKFTLDGGDITVQIGKGEAFSGRRLNIPESINRNASPQHSNNLNISIQNSGPGIPPDRVDKIFDRFYQVDDSHTRDQEGTGIGLALTKELVELHHGHIKVKSIPNQRTEFTVSLLMGKDHLEEDQIVAEDMVVSPESGEKWESVLTERDDQSVATVQNISDNIILTVEDNADMRTYIRETLQPDYQVIEAYDGEEGFEQAIDVIPDLIISDLMMPKMDGYQLCRELKDDERTSHIPVILLTAKAERKDKLAGLELGADDYLLKPFDSQELQIRIKNLIEIRKKLQTLFQNGKVIISEDNGSKPSLNPVDERFIERVMELVKENLTDENFDVQKFSREIGMSGTQLRRKMNALAGQSPNQFIRSQRLKEAARLIREEQQTVSETAYLVGFNSLSYFSKCFQEEFGILPSEY